jgi:phage portal protein BeeE
VKLWERALSARHQVFDATWNGEPLYSLGQSWAKNEERSLNDFRDYVENGYRSNGIVFGCILARILLLSEVEFAFQDPATRDLSRTPALRPLEMPWPNGSTGELVARREQDVSLAGNSYVRRDGAELARMRPDWTLIVKEPVEKTGRTRLLGYGYFPEGPTGEAEPIALSPGEVSHWSPIPDPMRDFVGMSWLSSVAREVLGDNYMSEHKNKFFTNAGTPNLFVSVKQRLDDDKLKLWSEKLEAKFGGWQNAYKSLVLDSGADAKVIGQNMEEMTFAVVQAAGENRVAVAAGVPAIVAGIKEGLQASTYSNYGQAMRRFADLTARPMWRSMCAAFSSIIPAPPGKRLWYDPSNIAALKDDAKDAADVRSKDAATIKALTEAGYTPESVVAAVKANDMGLLTHTGKFSVQLHPAGVGNGTGA